jgi:hypothetical protein
MPELTPEGEKIVAALAERYAISVDAVKIMLEAMAKGGGTMAQFNVPEFGGSGQWMRGAMTMIGDMFNNSLKATVENLCNELSNLLTSHTNIFAPVAQSHSRSQDSLGGEGVSLRQSSPQAGSWWPSELGNPSATGSQNNLRYAYFPASNRLAIDDQGRVEVYDTSGHDIRGFGQQQSGDASLTFTSQRGVVRVDSLPRAPSGARPPLETRSPQESPSIQRLPSSEAGSVLALIEQLSQLKEKGLLTEEEFSAKKAKLLERL